MSFFLCCFIFFQEERTLTFFPTKKRWELRTFPHPIPSQIEVCIWPPVVPTPTDRVNSHRGSARRREAVALCMAPGVYASPRPRTPPSHGTAVEVQPRPAGWKGGEQLDFLVVKNHGESVFFFENKWTHGISHWYWYTRWLRFSFFLEFSPRSLGKWSHFDEYFSDGSVQPPTRYSWKNYLIYYLFSAWKMLGTRKGYSWNEVGGFGEIFSQNLQDETSNGLPSHVTLVRLGFQLV